MARKPDFDLAAELAKPSFTPAQKDATALVELVAIGEDVVRQRASLALAGLGEVGRKAIEARLQAELARGDDELIGELRRADEADPDMATTRGTTATTSGATPARERRDRGAPVARVVDPVEVIAYLVGALGKCATRDPIANASVRALIKHTASRVRRAVINTASKLDGPEVQTMLFDRWDASDVTPDERRALAEALGKVGGEAALSRLRALEPGDDAELARRRDRALLMAGRDAKRDEDSRVLVDVAPPFALAVRLRCKPGLASLLREELLALGLSAKTPLDDSADIVLDKPWNALFASKLWATAAIRFPLVASKRDDGRASGDDARASGDDPRAIVDVLTSDPVRSLLRAWTGGPIRWRLGFAEGKQRSVIWRVAKEVTARAPELVNDPTQTTWDVRIDDDGHGARVLELSPRRFDDPRFAWRVAEVPAASHPSVAAALAYVAADGVKATGGLRVWDPFCGSGQELVERALRGGVKALVGTDLDDAALEAARKNVDAAKLTAQLGKADARTHDPGSVDLVITNPPLGSRVQVDAGKLLVDALPNFAKRLAPGGRLVWITPQTKKTTPVVERLGLRLAKRYPVDLGGVRGHLERWDR